MTQKTVRAAVALTLGLAAATLSLADGSSGNDRAGGRNFNRIATIANYLNNAPGQFADSTVSEILAATKDGMTLVYTDSPLEQVGFVDISDPTSPVPTGTVAVGGEPTSVDVFGNEFVLVAVNTSESYVNPSGKLVVLDVATRSVVREIDLGGQPDSLKISADRRYAAIAIENERDEDLGDGAPPQLPAGYLTIIDLRGSSPAAWSRRDVALTGLAGFAPEDPEPEFVDINGRNEAVVTLQENNHFAVVDLQSGRVLRHFSAGSVSLDNVDAVEDDRISLTDSIGNVPREPDAAVWLPGPFGKSGIFATANEGDLAGGSRGFSIFTSFGQTLFGSDIYKIDVGLPKDPIFLFESAFDGGVLVNKEDLYAAVIAAALVALLSLFFQKTATGRALRAVADDHQAAQSIGIPLNRIWVIVWSVAGFVALVAGVIWGSKLGVQFSLSLVALKALPVVILGGLTSVPGAIIGGLIIGVGEKFAEVFLGPIMVKAFDLAGGGIENWFAYVLALAFLLVRPEGLFGEKHIDRV